MLVLLLKIACLTAAAFNFVVQAVYFTRMLQQNDYLPAQYRKWCRDNDEQLVDLKHLVPFLCIPAMWLQGKVDTAFLYGAATVILLLTAVLNFPKKTQTPLVLTPRVWRLFIVQFVILALVITSCIFISAQRAIGILGLFSIIVWLWTGVAAHITLPLENRIAKKSNTDKEQTE